MGSCSKVLGRQPAMLPQLVGGMVKHDLSLAPESRIINELSGAGQRHIARVREIAAAQIIESIYGALVAYSQQVMLRMKAEDPEVGGVDHAFRAGQAYGVSCVLNHLIDQLTDVVGATALGALDDFSDTLHDEIIVQSRAAGLTVELLDAKGDILFE